MGYIKCFARLAIHFHGTCAGFGPGFHGWVEGDGWCGAPGGAEGKGIKGNICEHGFAGLNGGEGIVVLQVVGEGALVVGI